MSDRATIREWLDRAKFNWENGRVIWHPTPEDVSPGGWDRSGPAVEVGKDHEVLNTKFYTGFGGPMCPRFVAFDAERIYFPEQYDGATSLTFVYRNADDYLGDDPAATPYPGG